MSYTPFYPNGWKDWPDVSTPITAAALTHIESGISGAGGAVEITDGTHTVAAATEIDFTSGATVTDAGGGLAQVSISAGAVSPLTTKGDLWGFDTANDRIPVGSNGQALIADSTQALGVKWGTPIAEGNGDESLNVIASTSTTLALNIANGATQDITLTSSPTLSFTSPAASSAWYMTLLLRQDATGSRTVTWPTITWLGSGVAPILQTASSAVDSVVVFTDDGGTTWFGVAQTSASGLKAGTSFPGSPSDGDLFYRTDRRIIYEYNSTVTRWLSLDRKYVPFGAGIVLPGTESTGNAIGFMPIFEDIYVESWVMTSHVITTNNSSNFWTFTLSTWTPGNSASTVASQDTHLDTVANWVSHTVSIASLFSSSSVSMFEMDASKTSTPGSLTSAHSLIIRSAG